MKFSSKDASSQFAKIAAILGLLVVTGACSEGPDSDEGADTGGMQQDETICYPTEYRVRVGEGTPQTWTFAYENGRAVELSNEGITWTFEYNGNGKLASIKGGTGSSTNFVFSYDSQGRMDAYGTESDPMAADVTYGAQGRVEKAGLYTFKYDSDGNLTELVPGGGSIPVTNDENGNPIVFDDEVNDTAHEFSYTCDESGTKPAPNWYFLYQ